MDEATPREIEILERMLADIGEAGLRPLESYLERFADDAELVRQCHARMQTPAAAGTSDLRLGAFVLEEIAGRGGQGVVWRALDTRLGRTVALKVLSPQFALFDPATRHRVHQRFEREAAAASRLTGQGICTVYEVGEHDATPWIAMQWIEGASLDRVLTACRATSTSSEPIWHDHLGTDARSPVRQRILRVVGLLAEAARAIQRAHAQGLVHRDLKPGNLMLTPDGSLVVLDFGLVFDEAFDATSLTHSNEQLGSPAYMAPEQLEGDRERVGPATDVYALGVTLFECLTQVRPFEEATRQRLFQAIRSAPRPDLRSLLPAAPRDLARVLACALDVDPARRYVSAAAFAEELQRVIDGTPVRARPLGPGIRTLRLMRRNPVASTFALMLVVLSITIAWTNSRERSRLEDANRALAATNAALAESQRETSEALTLAESRERQARRSAYVAGVRAAGSHRGNREFEEARRQLEACPEEHRDFVWRHLHLATDPTHEERRAGLPSASSDGRIVATMLDAKTVTILDDAGGTELVHPVASTEKLHACVVNGAGDRLILLTRDRQVSVLELPNLRTVRTLTIPELGMLTASPSGRHLAVITPQRRMILLDSTADGTRSVVTQMEQVGRATFLDDGCVATVGGKDGLRLTSTVDGSPLGVIDCGFALAIAGNRDGTRIAVGTWATPPLSADILVFDRNGERVARLAAAHRGLTSHLSFHHLDDDILLSCGQGRELHVWSVRASARRHTFQSDWIDPIYQPWFSHDGTAIVGYHSLKLRRIGAFAGLGEHRLATHASQAVALLATTGELLVGKTDRIESFEPDTGRRQHVVRLPLADLDAFAIDRTHERIACTNPAGHLLLLERATTECSERPPVSPTSTRPPRAGEARVTNALAFAPDESGRLLHVDGERRLHLHAARPEQPSRTASFESQIRTATFSFDGRTIYAAGDIDVLHLSVPDLELQSPPATGVHRETYSKIAASPDGQWLVAAEFQGESLRCWDLRTNETKRIATGQRDPILHLQFSPDGRSVLAASNSGTVRMWDLESGDLLFVRHGQWPSRALAFEPDADRLWIVDGGPIALEARRPDLLTLASRRQALALEELAMSELTRRIVAGWSAERILHEERGLPRPLHDECVRTLAENTKDAGTLLECARYFLARTERSPGDRWAADWCRALERSDASPTVRATRGLALLREGSLDLAAIELGNVDADPAAPPADRAIASAALALLQLTQGRRPAAAEALSRARAHAAEGSFLAANRLIDEAEALLAR